MKKITFTLLALLIVSTVLFSCKKEEKEEENTDEIVDNRTKFTFAELNTEWKYSLSASITIYGQEIDIDGTIYEMVIAVNQDSIYTIRHIVDYGISYLENDTSEIYSSVSDYYVAECDDQYGSDYFLMCASDSEVGDTYTFTSSGTIYTREILSVSTTITTDAGNFTCFKIKETNDNNSNENTYYINYDIGMVYAIIQTEVYSQDVEAVIELLQKY